MYTKPTSITVTKQAISGSIIYVSVGLDNFRQ